MKRRHAIAASLVFALTGAIAHAAEPPLKIIAIDVDGGASTLFVTPQGHAALIDTGWPEGLGMPPAQGEIPGKLTSAQRIAAAAKDAGVTRIDYLITSHY